jgi:hypothetical protein
MRQSSGSELVAALEHAWAAIAARHADVPAAMVIVGSGSEGRSRGLRLGHFAAGRWAGELGEPVLGEVFVAGEGLDRGAVEVLGTLLHEAAHAVAHARGVQDTSRQGRYHNRRFAQLAGDLGLEAEHHPLLGWSLTSVPGSTAASYGPTLAALERALTAHRLRELPLARPRSSDRNGLALMCGCGRRIRIAPRVLALGPVLCGACGEPFTRSPA